MSDLDAAAVAAVDSTGQAGEILDLATHIRDAVWRVESAGIAPGESAGLVIAGMGGSGIGARLAHGVLGDRARRPVVLTAGYALPSWIDGSWTVLCSSYSGNTEETLAAYDAAAERGCPRIVATTNGGLAERARRDGMPVVPLPGGFQPRAAVGYATVVALEIARLVGAAPDLRAEIEAAAARVEADAAAWGPAQEGSAKTLARALDGTIPVVIGSELTGPVAYRWKCQFNENAKVASFSAELPEADHNEICSWVHAAEAARFSAVFLGDPGLHERNVARIALTAAEIERAGVPVTQIELQGGTPLERVMSLVLLGDLVTLYAAVLRGVDPVEIAGIDRLKAGLAEWT